MEQLNKFVERAVVFQKMVTADQLQQAKAMLAGNPGKSLMDALLETGALRQEQATEIEGLYEKNRARLESPRPGQPRPAAPQPAVSPSARPPTPSAAPPGARPAQPPGSAKIPGEMAETEPARAAEAPSKKPVLEVDETRVASLRTLVDFLGFAREIGATDLHITVGAPPIVRRHGYLHELPRDPFTGDETEELLLEVLQHEQRICLQDELALQFSHDVPGQGRYRSCIVRQRSGWNGAFRVIGDTVPSFEDLGLPEDLKDMTDYRQGMILVTGPKGCGKSTTMAALVEIINQRRDEHIVTLEDPIEYRFIPARCQIDQREVGSHTSSFLVGLEAALREDSDVIMIGELRDLESLSRAFALAETGHLVFGTLHTTSAARTINRILDMFPPEEENQARSTVSEFLRAVISQQLLPRADGSGMAVALEVMVNTPAATNLIRERKLFQLASVLLTGRKQGMRVFDTSLQELLNAGIIDGREAYFAAEDKNRFQKWAPKVSELECGE